MSDKSQNDFLSQTFKLLQPKSLSNTLKKRFLKKRNSVENNDQLPQCEKCALPEYAALTWLISSRNQASQGRRIEEAAALVKAGRLFLKSKDHQLGGVSCLSQAVKVWEPTSVNDFGGPIAASICLEIGESLQKSNPYLAISYLTKAVNLLDRTPALKVIALGHLATEKISIGDYHGALTLFTNIVNTIGTIIRMPFGVYNDILVRCEVSRILLILLLRPSPQKISPDLAKLVEKYTWTGEPDPITTSWLGEELFFLLQSLVMACQCQDLEAVCNLEEDLSVYFSNEQKDLFLNIVNEMNNSEK